MGRKEEALGEALKLSEHILHSEQCFVKVEDLIRFQSNPQGPEGHPLLIESKRIIKQYKEDKLLELRALPDGTPCLLWGRNLGTGHDPAAPQELYMQLVGRSSYTLGFIRPYIGLVGSIIGFLGARVPIINKIWFDYRNHKNDARSRLCIGQHEISATEDSATLRTWIPENDTCMRATRCLPGPDKEDPYYQAQWREYVYEILCGETVKLKDTIVITAERAHELQQRSKKQNAIADLGGGRKANKWQMPGHLMYGWHVDDVNSARPMFERISDLFQQEGRWRYWGQTRGHLFLMELPAAPKEE